MKSPITGILTLTLYLVLTVQPGPAQSPPGSAGAAPADQAAASGNVVQLPEIVVSASRVPLQARRVGSAVTVITAEEIERRQARVVSDLLRDVPGIAVHRSGPLGALTQVRIRGGEAGHTLVLVDGVRVNDPNDLQTSFDFGGMLVSDIERIEVLRGPQSGLYGSDAIGGVVHITTRSGRGPAVTEVSAEGGSFGATNLTAALRGGGDGFRFSVGATDFRTSGISIAEGPEKDGYRNRTYSAKLGADVNASLGIELFGRLVEGDLETDDLFEDPPDTLDTTDETRTTGRGRVIWTLFDGDWTHELGVDGHRTRRTFFDAASYQGAAIDDYDGTRFGVDYLTRIAFETSDAAHHVTFVAERGELSMRHRQRPAASREHAYRARSETVHRGYSAEYRMALQERLFVSGSARHDDNRRFRDTLTFRGTAAWLLEESGTRFHGSYGTGVKNPSLSQLFGRWGPNPDLRPERSRGWDIGVEQTFLARRLSIDATYFVSRLTNLIAWHDQGTADFADDGFANVAGASRIRGVELTLRGRPADGLDLSAHYTFTDAEDARGQPLRRRARHIASANVGHGFLDGRAAVDLGIDYNGAQVNSHDQPRLPSYVLVNLAARYRITRDIELFGRIENLFDKDYHELRASNRREYRTTGIGFYAGVRGAMELF